MTKNVWIYAIFLGLTAGIFEEVGRYIAFKTVLRKHLNWENGVAFGIGHGGIESIIIVGLSYISNLIMAFMINNGLFDTLIGPTMSQELVTQLKSQMIDTPSYMFLIASLERALTFVIHIGFSVLVMLGIRKGKGLLYLLLAILLHMLLDASVVIMSSSGVNAFIIEGFVGICTIVAIVFLVKTRNDAKDKEGEIGFINE